MSGRSKEMSGRAKERSDASRAKALAVREGTTARESPKLLKLKEENVRLAEENARLKTEHAVMTTSKENLRDMLVHAQATTEKAFTLTQTMIDKSSAHFEKVNKVLFAALSTPGTHTHTPLVESVVRYAAS